MKEKSQSERRTPTQQPTSQVQRTQEKRLSLLSWLPCPLDTRPPQEQTYVLSDLADRISGAKLVQPRRVQPSASLEEEQKPGTRTRAKQEHRFFFS